MSSYQSPFDEKNKVKAAWINFNKVGDFFSGTFVSKRIIDNRLPNVKKGQEQVPIYEFIGHEGEFHKLDLNKQIVEPGEVVKAGDTYIVGGGKGSIDNAMRSAKLGQIVGFRFDGVKPSKTPGFNPTKLISVYCGVMDPDFQGQTADDEGGDLVEDLKNNL